MTLIQQEKKHEQRVKRREGRNGDMRGVIELMTEDGREEKRRRG